MIGKRYKLHDLLGQGGMGAVYRATDRLTGDIVALKRVLLDPANLDFNSRSRATELHMALAREFEILASLRHPNIITVLDYGFDAERNPYFTMPYLRQATPLSEVEIPLQQRTALIVQMLQALAYLHRRGILHRDLKPANVMVEPDGHVFVLDFGLAQDRREPSNITGTVAYLAPEILENKQATPAADLFAVGVVAFELLASQHPFGLDLPLPKLIQAILHQRVDLDLLPGDDMAPVSNIVVRLLAKDPTQRFPTAAAAIEALQTAINDPLPVEDAAIRDSYLQAASFVGRQYEMHALADALEGALETGHGSAWLVGGESGVGKSRLMDELARLAQVRGALVVRGYGVEGGGTPYELWRHIMPPLLLTSDVSDHEAGVLQEIMPNLGTLLQRRVVPPPLLSGTSHQQRLVGIISDIIKRLTAPVLLILEDLQWANESLVPLRQLLDDVYDLPLMVVGTYRHDERPRLPDELPGIQELWLERLTGTEIAALTKSMLGGHYTDLVRFLQHQTEGNVYFVIETVRALAEEAGSLDRVGANPLPENLTAGGMQRLLQRRLEQVPQWAYGSLQVAAIAGRELDLAVLHEILTPLLRLINTDSVSSSLMSMLWREQRSLGLQDWLLVCADAAILEVRDGRWRFTHDKLREQLLADMDPTQRGQLHQHVAEAIERVYPGDRRFARMLADHWFQAGDTAATLHYTLVTGDTLLSAASFGPARAILQRAIPLAEEDDRSRMWLLVMLGDCHDYLGNHSGAAQCFEEALALAHRLNSHDAAARCHSGLGLYCWHVDDYEGGADHARRAVSLYRDLGVAWGVGHNLNTLGLIAYAEGDMVTAEGYFAHSLTVCEQTQDRWGVALCNLNLGNTALHHGNLHEARALYHSSLETFKAMEGRWGVALALASQGTANCMAGDCEEGLRKLRRSLKLRREIGDRPGVADSLARLGKVSIVLEDYEAASTQLHNSVVIFRQIGERRGIADVLAALARVELGLGQPYRALEALRESLRVARSIQNVPLLLEGVVSAALVAAYQGEFEYAARLVGLVNGHERTSQAQKDNLMALDAELQTALDAGYETALALGQAVELSTVVDEVLDEVD